MTKEGIFINIIKSLRPKQWSKNLFVFAAILFSQNILNLNLLNKVIVIFVLFSFLSSGVYILNDIIDIERDKLHPKKKNRPIAAGKLPINSAIILAIVLCLTSILYCFKIGIDIGVISLIYFLQSVLYSLYFKNVLIIDLFFISFGFLLRVIIGGVAINVDISVWLLICITVLSLFLGLCKRRHEINLLNGAADNHRSVLKEYSKDLLDQMISIVTSSILVFYTLYTFLSNKNKSLMLTIPFVLYGVFRYLYLVYTKDKGGAPEEILIKDAPTVINLVLWVSVSFTILYIIR